LFIENIVDGRNVCNKGKFSDDSLQNLGEQQSKENGFQVGIVIICRFTWYLFASNYLLLPNESVLPVTCMLLEDAL
jgi:hypothetical protein